MAPNDSPRKRREREITLKRQEQAAQEAYRRARRNQTAIGIGVVVFVLLAIVLVVRAATGEKTATSTTTGPGRGSTTTVPYTGPTASLPTPAPGSTLATPAGCPPTDGSAPRITKFAAPPPDCLDPALRYTARIRTTRGAIIMDIDTDTVREAANSFIFLARYHYYDGLPFTSIQRGAYAEVADPVNPDGSRGPGYLLPATKRTTAISPITVALSVGPGGVSGGLLVAMPGNDYLKIPDTAPAIGQVLTAFAEPRRPDRPDWTVQQEINDAATPSGAPKDVITIQGVDVIGCPDSDVRCADRVFNA